MPCVILLLLFGAPRLAIFVLFLFSNYLGRAYETNFWPFLGFLFMPLTTLAYAWSMNTFHGIQGFGLAAVIVAVLFDLGVIGSARRRRRPKSNVIDGELV